MAVRTVNALAGEVATSREDPTKKVPAPLRRYEKMDWVSICLLILIGSALIVGTLVWFGADHQGGGGFVSKTVVTTGTGASQKVSERDYSDTVVIFALTAGSALLLAGCLYGRLRDITLGGVKVELDDDQGGANKESDEGAGSTSGSS